jgi:hypothetical protein
MRRFILGAARKIGARGGGEWRWKVSRRERLGGLLSFCCREAV